MSVSENNEKLVKFTAKKFENGEINNDGLVQQIELCFSYLNLVTIPEYAKIHNMSYNGVKNNRKIIIIGGVKFVIDNN
jgi:hypothetical protein